MRPGRVIVIAAGLFLAAGAGARAQNIRIEGTVTMKDGGPVEGVEVVATSQKEGRGVRRVKTRDDGTYKIPFAEFGLYKVSASKKGLLMHSLSVVIRTVGNEIEFEQTGQIGPDQALPEFTVQPGRTLRVDFVMVPSDWFQKAGEAAAAPSKAEEMIVRANNLTHDRNYAASDELLKEIRALGEGEDARVYYLMGVNAAGQGRSEEAVGLLEKARSLDPLQKGISAQLGSIAYQSGDRDKAIEHMGRELEVSPDAVAVRINLAMMLTEAGRLQDAAAEYEKVVEMAPQEQGAYAELATIYTELGDEEKAAAAMKRLEDLGGGDPARWFNIGANFSNGGEFEKAEQAYRKALEIDPEFPEASRELGFLMLRKGDMKAAAGFFERYLKIRPDALDAGEVRSILGQIKAAG